MKKIISSIIILLLILNNIIISVYAVDTNGLSAPWTIQKAEHLAKKALFGATKEKVLELYNAGSAESAVNILFPSINGPDRTLFNEKMSSLLDPEWLIDDSDIGMREYYAFKKLEDPYEAKAKLFGIFEDTFSVDTIRDRINYGDIENTYDLLYSHTLGNYKEMVKRNFYNNGNPGDYSLGEYLDLFNQTNYKYPNENYAREILQLFLMLEYKPTESEDLGNTRNYTEEDVNAMAKIIIGFDADENTHKVTYNESINLNTEITFLSGSLKSGDNFPFYNSLSGTLDIQAMKNSINGNNGLADNVIDYIFSKREESIAIFLADKLYRFYIAEDPSREDLDLITNKIIENKFEIYPTVKWLLSSNLMYSEKSMNSVIYKNPLELAIGTAKILGLNSDILDYRYMLTNLGWTPYDAGKIFGRDGYDDNSIFFTSYIGNRWTTESSKLASLLIDNNLNFIQNRNSANEIITELEEKLYLGKKLDQYTKEKLINYLTHDKDGNEIEINFEDNNYIAKNIHGLIYIMLNQPEYILQSGYDKISNDTEAQKSFFKNENKIVFIKASGGLDWLHVIIPKNEYTEYKEYRSTGALTGTGLISLDDNYYINGSMQKFADLYKQGYLKIINRVGTPDHSRSHDGASRKITSIDNTYNGDGGIFGNLISEEDPSKTIVLDGGAKPSIFRSGKYMGIGSSALFKVYYGKTYIDANEREYKISTLKDILKNRDYTGKFGDVFKNSAIIDDVARESVANGGREGSGYNMNQRFTFLQSLYNGGLGNASWMRADGGYDNHRNEKDYLNKNLGKVANETTDFFNRIKDKYNVTIVIYSEFGRTNYINNSIGTDHGKGGGMFIISNNNELINKELPKKVYGNNSFKDSKYNWLGIGIDYRSVYTAIYKALYNIDISNKLGSVFNINDYIDNTSSDIELLRYKHTIRSKDTFNSYVEFNVDDKNFFSSEASHIKFEYWTEKDPIREKSTYSLDRSRINEKEYSINIVTEENTKYFYKLTIYDNQYNTKVINGEFTSPIVNSTFSPTVSPKLSKDRTTFFYNFKKLVLENGKKELINSSTGIILSDSGTVEYLGDDNDKIIANSGTYVTEINGNTGAIWYGFFNNPIKINPNDFIGNLAKYEGKNINTFKINKLIKVGANDLGIGMKLNKEVDVEINNIPSNKNYLVLTSEDGINWIKIDESKIIKSNNKIKFKTNHFSYFLVIETDNNGNIITVSSNTSNTNITSNITSHSSGGARLKKDKCKYGDLSPSYYDGICGVDPYTIHENSYSEMYMDLKDDIKSIKKHTQKKLKTEKEIKLAYIELKMVYEEKAKVYENLFTQELVTKIEEREITKNNIDEVNKLISQKEVLILLREKFSYVNISGFKLIHIKESKLNKIFEALTQLIINKKFNLETENQLLNYINTIVIYSAINELNNIDNITKENNKVLLKKEIKKLVGLYKIAKKEKSNIKKTETIKEKIERINKQKKKEIAEKIKRINKKNQRKK